MTKSADDAVLEITRMFDAAPAEVFDAWLSREEFQAWIGPEGVRCDVPVLEPRVGGAYRLTMHLADGGTIEVKGIFKAIEAGKSLAFTWGMGTDARQTLVTLSFRDVVGRTELTLRQEGLPTVADREGHRDGWSSAFNKLAGYLTRTRGVSSSRHLRV